MEIKTFSSESIKLGEILGKGGFSAVHSCFHHDDDHVEQDRQDDRNNDKGKDTPHMAVELLEDENEESSLDECHKPSSSPRRSREFAVKQLRSSVRRSARMVGLAAQELQLEASILAELRGKHPNIIRLEGVSDDFFEMTNLNLFLVLEKLEATLDQEILQWKQEQQRKLLQVQQEHQQKRIESMWERFASSSSKIKQDNDDYYLSPKSQAKRIEQVALPIVSAVQFLHKNQIVYHDLKPSNIGFDREGTVRLFDFASSLRCESSSRGSEYMKPCKKGTIPYMAPEVARFESYQGYKADVYSFGIVLWELLTYEKPYSGDKEEMIELVENPDTNPLTLEKKENNGNDSEESQQNSKIASSHVQFLLRKCWSEQPKDRPSFTLVHACLSREVKKRQN